MAVVHAFEQRTHKYNNKSILVSVLLKNSICRVSISDDTVDCRSFYSRKQQKTIVMITMTSGTNARYFVTLIALTAGYSSCSSTACYLVNTDQTLGQMLYDSRITNKSQSTFGSNIRNSTCSSDDGRRDEYY